MLAITKFKFFFLVLQARISSSSGREQPIVTLDCLISMESLTINCRFCKGKIGAPNGNLGKLESHMQHSHDMYYEKDLAFLLNFLSDGEIQVLVTKLTARMDIFRAVGTLGSDENVFGESLSSASNIQKREIPNVKEKIEIHYESDEEIETLFEKSEGRKHFEDEDRIREVEQFLQEDSDDDDSTVYIKAIEKHPDEYDNFVEEKDDVVIEKQNEFDSSSIDYEVEQKRKIENMLISDDESEESDNNSGENEESPEADVEEEAIKEDPLKESINLKEEIVAAVKLEQSNCEAQTIDSKGGDSKEEEKSKEIASGKFDHINLVLSFKSRNFCRLCYDACGSEENLKRHEELKHSDERESLARTFFNVQDLKYKCEFCPQIPGFLTENLVRYHKRRDHKGKKLPSKVTCHLCEKQFQVRSFKVHLETHKTELDHECNICYKKFKMSKYLNHHQKKYHPEESKFFEKTIDSSQLSHHCSKCDKRFLTEDILKYHMKDEHSSSGNITESKNAEVHQCKLCYRELKSLSNLKAHQKVHKEDLEAFERDIGEEELKYNCQACDINFISSHVLTHHSLLQHSTRTVGRGKYECVLCREIFTKQDSVSRHCKNFHSQDLNFLSRKCENIQPEFQCKDCSLSFLSSNLLRHHTSRKHSGNFPTQKIMISSDKNCKLCYISFKHDSNLRRHIQAVHKSDRQFLDGDLTESDLKFSCNKCDKKFVRERILKNHLSFHKQVEYADIRRKSFVDKFYKCSLCHIKYKDFTNLTKHIEKIHNDHRELVCQEFEEAELRYKCDSCDLKFLKEAFLSYHKERTHQLSTSSEFSEKYYRNKRYTCPLCYCNYRNSTALKKHFSKIHGDEEDLLDTDIKEENLVYSCNHCSLKFMKESHMRYHSERKHIKSKIRVDIKGKNCELCGIKFKKSRNFRMHVVRIHSKELEVFDKELHESDLTHKCDKCKKRFYTNSSLEHHQKRSHRRDKVPRFGESLECSLCYKTFTFGHRLRRHQKAVHRADLHLLNRKIEPEDLQYKCRHCLASFVSVDILKYHTRAEHADQSAAYCKLCHYVVSKGRSGMENHKTRVHSDVADWAFNTELSSDHMKFSCQSCDQKFLTESSVVFHSFQVHRGLGKTFCNLCQADFTSRASLKQHKGNIHVSLEEMRAFGLKQDGDNLSYPCNFCDKRFLTGNILNYHRSYTHKIERRKEDVQCEDCEETWPWSSNRANLIRNHKKEVHGDNTSPPDTNETLQNFLNVLNSL